MSILFQNEIYEFTLKELKGQGQTGAEITRRRQQDGEEMVCRTVDIVRKTRFAIAERHLKHLPHQTYPPVEGRQGPYGHP